MRLTRDGGPAETEPIVGSPGVPGMRSLVATVVLTLLAGGCADQESSVVRPDDAAISLSEREEQAAQEAEAFAAVIDSLNDDNEILIALKDRDVPVVSPEFAGGDKAELASGQPGVAFPVVPEGAPRREAEGFAPAGADARDKIRTLLTAHDVDVSGEGRVFPVIRTHLPEGKVVPVLKALLSSPYVDYVEAAHAVSVSLPAEPVGTNGTDLKHDIHEVQKAWDFTRGEGAKIGVFDSGFAGWSIGNWHPDGDYDSAQGHGIVKLGFEDDYGSCNPGDCEPRDDHWESNGKYGHGRHMTGLIGMNDNDSGWVGIAPFAQIYSMKVVHSCLILNCGGDGYAIGDWAFVDALDYAAMNDFDVASMSLAIRTGLFDGWSGSAVEDALYQTYNDHDVLLLAASGNPGHEDHQWLVEKSYVMGVGGINNDSTNYGLDEHEDISALSGGITTEASCDGWTFCDPNGYTSSGGTSASTANSAAIAGLVRSYYPGWSAPTVRDWLKSTANLRQSVMLLNAYEAIVNNPPDPAISGPRTPYKQVNETWEAFVDDGKPPFTYEWTRDGIVVSTSDTYTGNTGCFDFVLHLTVTDSEDRINSSGDIHIEPDGFEPGSPNTCMQ